MDKKMLINAVEPEESRIAVLEDGVVEELYLERQSLGQIVGNIYKAKVVNVEPSIEAAFLDFGGDRNGFLHASDTLPTLRDASRGGGGGGGGGGGAKGHGKRGSTRRIDDLLRQGQEVLVQVTKIGIGNKGPALTTYISIPGRYLVLMPDVSKLGVSKKIEDEEQRQRLKQLLKELSPPSDMGFIVRTAGMGQTKRDLERDLRYLLKLWRVVSKRAKKEKVPALIYQESDLVMRTIRDILSADIKEILVDDPNVYERVKDFLHQVMPHYERRAKRYTDAEPLFHRFKVEGEIEKIRRRQVELPMGGSIVFDQTEALVAVDVNSGRFTDGSDAEETAYKINMAAAKEIARQLRLRDLGGVVVSDFIDMRDAKHQRSVERTFADALKRDRARTKMLRMSRFGLIELTRQRMRPSLNLTTYQTCPLCGGTGRVKSLESACLDVMRELRAVASRDSTTEVELIAHSEVASYLLNEQRAKLADIEETSHVRIYVRPDIDAPFEQTSISSKSPKQSPKQSPGKPRRGGS